MVIVYAVKDRVQITTGLEQRQNKNTEVNSTNSVKC